MIRLALTASTLTIAAFVYGIPALCYAIAYQPAPTFTPCATDLDCARKNPTLD